MRPIDPARHRLSMVAPTPPDRITEMLEETKLIGPSDPEPFIRSLLAILEGAGTIMVYIPVIPVPGSQRSPE